MTITIAGIDFDHHDYDERGDTLYVAGIDLDHHDYDERGDTLYEHAAPGAGGLV
jgi:hypothetical protein